jgi:hypothetical protein
MTSSGLGVDNPEDALIKSDLSPGTTDMMSVIPGVSVSKLNGVKTKSSLFRDAIIVYLGIYDLPFSSRRHKYVKLSITGADVIPLENEDTDSTSTGKSEMICPLNIFFNVVETDKAVL